MIERQLVDILKNRLEKFPIPVSYTHLRAHETPEHLVCRLLLEKKKQIKKYSLTQKTKFKKQHHKTIKKTHKHAWIE